AVDGVHVQPVEENLERRAERQAATAAAADVVDAPQLLVDRAAIPELRRLQIESAHGDERDPARAESGGRIAGGVDETRSRHAIAGEPRRDGAQPRRVMRTRAAWSNDSARDPSARLRRKARSPQRAPCQRSA